MQVFQTVVLASLACVINAAPVEFSKISQRDRVRLVLSAGGNCEGQVVSRTDSELSIKLAKGTTECGPKDKIVSIRMSNTRSIVRTASHGRNSASGAIVAFTSVFGLLVGVEAQKPAEGAALAAGGIASVWLLNRHSVRYTIFVTDLG